MLKSHYRLLTTVTTVALFFSGAAALAEEQAQMKDLSDNLCKDVMILSGEARAIALAMAHGYRLGKKSTTQYDPEALGQISDKFMDYCLDNPKDKALAAFEKIAN